MTVKTLLLPLVLSLFALAYGAMSLFMVRPEEQAVITRGDEVVRVVGPGLQMHLPLLERVHTYPVLFERRTGLNGDFSLANCPAEVAVIYRIADVAAFHEGGGIGAYPASPTVVQRVLSSVPDDDPDPTQTARQRLHDALEVAGAPAFSLVRTHIDLGSCGPQPPGIEVVELPLATQPGSRPEGQHQSAPVNVTVLTADRRRVEIVGATASYDITDPDRFAACFGSTPRAAEIAGDRLSHLVSHTLRDQAQSVPIENFGPLIAERVRNLPSFAGDMEAQCGIDVAGIDLTSVRMTQMIEVNCDETPEAEACRPRTGLRPFQP